MNDALRNIFVKIIGNLWKERAEESIDYLLFLQYVTLKVGAASGLGRVI